MKTKTRPNNCRRILPASIAAATFIAGTASASVTVINGGFEDITGMTPNGDFYQGGTIPGWSFSGITAEVATTSAFGTPAGVTGNNYLEVFVTDPNGLGTLSQTVSGMTIGQDYKLTFDWGNRADLGADQNYEFDVSIAGQTFSQFGTDPVDMTSAMIPFTASNTSETIGITFYFPGSFSYTDGAFDNFAINQVPEPSSTALIGLSGLGLIFRRRRQNPQPT
ncbi:MAG: PEP-CTERM sorting domain-containing protein [Akkermansiaceae bacterium]